MGSQASHRIATMMVAALGLAPAAGAASMAPALAAGKAPVAVEQGPEWSPARRNEFYTLDQGSQIMPLRWINALKLPDGSLFMADSLRRYGFLPNAASPHMLPVGFNAAGQTGSEMIGMTCAACHTRQIEYGGLALRIDGGPAIIDFQSFLSDLDTAVGSVLNDTAAFADFARAVLGGTHAPADETALRQAVSDWHHRYHTLMRIALPANPWGPGRLDAIGMIINRLTGLDLGQPPSYLIEANIKPADAPVRYPFLWNAARQDRTQWPGFADNSNEGVALGRNMGQLLGVFGEFHPEPDATPDKINYATHNSTNIENLVQLETLMTYIGSPRWPWAIDDALAKDGKEIFDRKTAAGGCIECHGERPSSINPDYWDTTVTPIDDVDTDRRELRLLDRMSETGLLEGTPIPEVFKPSPGLIKKDERSLEILTFAVVGTIRDSIEDPADSSAAFNIAAADADKLKELNKANVIGGAIVRGYEARVLYGVWAAAPYLHNGSVPTLTDLLMPAAERTASFKVGSAYDPVKVGLAVDQTQFDAILTTTDCGDRESGNSRCGHEYGTDLEVQEKKALLEYLKQL